MSLLKLRKEALSAMRLTLVCMLGSMDGMDPDSDRWGEYVQARDVLKEMIRKQERMVAELNPITAAALD